MLGTDTQAGLAHLTGLPLKLGICTLADATLTDTPAIADLPVCGHARRRIQRTVARTASVVRIALTHTTLANAISCN